MAWDRGERGLRGDHFSRGRRPVRDVREDDQDERYDYSSDDYDDDRYGRPSERRHWRGSEYENSSDLADRGRSAGSYDYDADAQRLLDRRHREGFLRGQSRGRHDEKNEDWRSGASRGGADLGDQDRWTGPYAGRGPKNYRRSDDRILEDVCERLMEHPSIDASDIEVTVDSGDVTLTGTVESRAVKHLTEVMTETVNGVKDVHNQLRVARRETGSAAVLPDEAIDRQRR